MLAPLAALRLPPFVAHPLLRSGHAQTTVVPFLPAPSIAHEAAAAETMRIPIAGGALVGRLHRARRPATACVVVLHGIAGTAGEPFVVRTASLAAHRGLDALRLDLRGAGSSSECGPPLYHAGLTEDLHAVVSFLRRRYARVHLVGFSLGGQLVLRTAGELGDAGADDLASVTAISPPVDLAECARWSERVSAMPYRRYILRLLKRRFVAFRAGIGPHVDARRVHAASTIREHDEALIAPLFGFRDVDDYYARSSAEPVLDRIAVPTLVVHAADDPLVTVEPILRVQRRSLPAIRVVITEGGGHVGFLAHHPAPGDRSRFWAEERAIDLAVATT